ncbi:unnamed protein product, partial [Meganyctiphanes norvegica]
MASNVSCRNVTPNVLKVFKLLTLKGIGNDLETLTLQFVSHSFQEYHDPTIEDAYQQQAVIDSEAALLDILDTAGQIEFTAMREQYMRCGEGFLICYSITDRRSFEEVAGYRKLIAKVRGAADTIPIVLCGNKVDLDDPMHRKVSSDEGQALATSMGCPFFETSAALRLFVDDAFHALVREIRCKQKEVTGESVRSKPLSRWRRFKNIFLWIFGRARYK